MASNYKTESSSGDDGIVSGTLPTSKTRDSLIEKCKQSGLAIRRYLYCMEPSATESSSDEDDFYKRDSSEKVFCTVSREKGDDACRPRLCGRFNKPSKFLKPLNDKTSLFRGNDLDERQILLHDEASKSDKDDHLLTCAHGFGMCPSNVCKYSPSGQNDECLFLGSDENNDSKGICEFHNYFPGLDRVINSGNINCDYENTQNHDIICEKQQLRLDLSDKDKPTCKRKFKLNIANHSCDNVSSLNEGNTSKPKANSSKCNTFKNDKPEKSPSEKEDLYKFPNFSANRSNHHSFAPQNSTSSKSYLSLDSTSDMNSSSSYPPLDSACDVIDVNHLETLLDYSPSGYMTSLARVNIGDEDTVDDACLVGSEESDVTHSGSGYNHALPYLSDRLRTNLVQRLGLSDLVGGSNGDNQRQGSELEIDQASAMAREEDSESIEGRQSDSNAEYVTEDRTLSDLLFDLHKIDMIDRVFLTETSERLHDQKNHSQTCSRQGEEHDPDSGDDADDEFDCECQFCLESRSGQSSSGCYGNDQHNAVDEEQQDTTRLDNDNTLLNSWLMDDDSTYAISSVRLPPLDMLIQERRADLERMFETVIMQMLAVYPDLLTDQAPPPASSDTIDSLLIAAPTSQQISQKLSCPICLSVYEESDSTTILPCHHLFHPLCIQAWLSKSGTCPVCRFILE